LSKEKKDKFQGKCLLILQARVLLPIKGKPLIVLAALRASNTGIPLLVATSKDQTDDLLETVLAENQIPCFRGSLNDTLSRFSDATKGLPPDSIIVRLTGDNVFPDGKFIEDIVDLFIQRKETYYARADDSVFPYGLSVEVFYKKCLDDANLNAESSDQREHVTPYIREKYGDTRFSCGYSSTFHEKRITIDYLEDYQFVSGLFHFSLDPIHESWSSLLENERRLSKKPFLKRLVLGTVQFGKKYGIKATKVTSEFESLDILRGFFSQGGHIVDTAQAYGNSEKIIGDYLKNFSSGTTKVITKLDPTIQFTKDFDTNYELVKGRVLLSCQKLKKESLDYLLIHNVNQIDGSNGQLIPILNRIKKEKLIENLGISINEPRDLSYLEGNETLSLIQMPFNIFDYRWFENNAMQVLQDFRSKGGCIHARSIFLQGLTFMREHKKWPKISNGYEAKEICSFLAEVELKTGKGIASICLYYALSQNWIDALVVGVEGAEQLMEIIGFFENPEMVSDDFVYELWKKIPVDLLSPSKWRLE
jgi:spore coat polysaccharide biosynthesis protein SpsF (cytidylyltransferase family)/aryl-alcohol dehydrogenase-like predicted oxidoreductase